MTIHDFTAKGRNGTSLDLAMQTSSSQLPSLFQIRLRAPHTADAAQWASTFHALSSNRAACDEVWLSTGVFFPAMDWHRGHAARLAPCAADLRRAGISPSLQIQATLGHGDAFAGSPEEMAGRTWGGFTGPSGVECAACNCPRQPAFLAYLREMTRLYAAAIRPAWIWIDDDLRVNNHRPAVAGEIGCWCPTCLAAFAAESRRAWTREALAAAVAEDVAVRAEWERFSFSSIAAVARAIAEEAHAVSPETRFGYQHAPWPNDAQIAVFRALRETSGHSVGSRPGGGAYYDLDPNGPVRKALAAARQRRVLGNPDWIDAWLPEIETYPRAFASRTARGILLEALVSLAYGMNGLSALVMDTRSETDNWYAENILAPLARERDLLLRYRDANAGTLPAGLDAPPDLPLEGVYGYALSGVPVVPGPGRVLGAMSAEEAAIGISRCTSRDLLRMRGDAAARAGGRLPALIEEPTVGLLVPRVAPDGALRSVMALNARIDVQPSVTLRLRGVAPDARTAVWRAFGEPLASLPVRRKGDETLVTLPSLAAWNAGWLDLQCPNG